MATKKKVIDQPALLETDAPTVAPVVRRYNSASPVPTPKPVVKRDLNKLPTDNDALYYERGAVVKPVAPKVASFKVRLATAICVLTGRDAVAVETQRPSYLDIACNALGIEIVPSPVHWTATE
jgi:hypothetical protein